MLDWILLIPTLFAAMVVYLLLKVYSWLVVGATFVLGYPWQFGIALFLIGVVLASPPIRRRKS
jgi:hypothetical protein